MGQTISEQSSSSAGEVSLGVLLSELVCSARAYLADVLQPRTYVYSSHALCRPTPTALHTLRLTSCSFRAHSLPSPSNLTDFFASARNLTLANLGLPHPSTHLHSILVASAATLRSLTVSSLRDVTMPLWREAMGVLATKCTNLRELRLGTLLSEQLEALTLSLPLALATRKNNGAALSLLPLHSLTLTIPHLSLSLLLVLPASLASLIIRSPSQRSSADTSATARTMNIEQLEEEGQVVRMVETAFKAGVGRALERVVFGGAMRPEKVRQRLEAAVEGAGRRVRIEV